MCLQRCSLLSRQVNPGFSAKAAPVTESLSWEFSDIRSFCLLLWKCFGQPTWYLSSSLRRTRGISVSWRVPLSEKEGQQRSTFHISLSDIGLYTYCSYKQWRSANDRLLANSRLFLKVLKVGWKPYSILNRKGWKQNQSNNKARAVTQWRMLR